MLAHDRVADLLPGGHGLADGSDVRVVPCVVVDQRGPISHAANLVAIIPPRHDLGVFGRVLAQPLVRLTIVVDDVLAAVSQPAGQDNGGGRVGVGGDPCAVHDEQDQIDGHGSDHGGLGNPRVHADKGLARRLEAALGGLLGRCLGALLSLALDGLGRLGSEVVVEDGRHGDGSRDTDDGSEREHQTDHDAGKVAAKQGVDHDEDVLVPQVLEAEVDTGREQPDEKVEVKEEGGPGSGLMLRNRRDDGDMDLGIARIPEGIETAAPRGDDAGAGGDDEGAKADGKDAAGKEPEEGLELAAGDGGPDVVQECQELQEAKDAWGGPKQSLARYIFVLHANRKLARWYAPNAGMCSLVLTGKKPTKGICMLASVPRAYQVVYET